MLVNMMLLSVVSVCNMRSKLNFFERAYLLARSNGFKPREARAYARLCVDYWIFNDPLSYPYLKPYSPLPKSFSPYLKSLY